MTAGVKGIFTMHGKSIEDIKNNQQVNFLIETKQIEKIILL
jgi:stage III sporulation protein SpoIIIAA